MAPAARVSTLQIVNALLKWRGRVKHAAEDLGITRKTLYERISREGLDLDNFRRAGSHVSPISGYTVNTSPIDSESSRGGATSGSRNERDGYRHRSGRPTVGRMSTSVSQLAPRREKPLRIPPDEEEVIRRGRRLLSAELNRDLDDNEVLAQFIRERFDGWVEDLRSRVSSEPEAEAEKKGRR